MNIFINPVMKDNWKGQKTIAFLAHLWPGNASTIVALGQGKSRTATFYPSASVANVKSLSSLRKKHDMYVLMATPKGPLTGLTVVRGHLSGSRHIGIRLHKDKLGDIESAHPRPFMRADAGNTVYLAWRLFNDVEVEVIEALAASLTKRVGGISLGHFFPLPYTIQQYDRSPITLEYLFKDRLCHVTDFLEGQSIAEADITLASDIEPVTIPWLWHNVIPRGALSLVAGPGGVGKSTIAAYIASIVSYGGVFPDGSRAGDPGGVIFFEAEDDTKSVVIPRLQAAGSDLSKIVTGRAVDLSHDVSVLEAAKAKLQGNVALVVLSPIRSFFGPETYIETEVRERLKAVLAWASENNAAVLGVSHPPRGKQDIAGATAWKNLARAGLFVDVNPKNKQERQLFPLKANNAPDDWNLKYVIEGVVIPGAFPIETSRIRWLTRAEDSQAVARHSLKPQESRKAVSGTIQPKETTPVYGLSRGSETTSNQVKRKNKRRDFVDGWLRDTLAKYGELRTLDVKALAIGSGISERSLSDAATRLGVVRTTKGFGGYAAWRLP